MSVQVNQLLNSNQRASKVNKDKSDVNTTKGATNLQTTTSSSSSSHIPQYREIKLQLNKGDSSEYYNLNLNQTESGWSVYQDFGRIHSSGQQITQNFVSQDEAMQYMIELADNKRAEGFHDVSCDKEFTWTKEEEIFPQPSSRATSLSRKGANERDIPNESNEDKLEEDYDQSRPAKFQRLDH